MIDTLLIIEDEQLLGSELQRHYIKSGYEVIWVQSYSEAQSKLQSNKTDPSLILSDLNLPDGNGLDLLEENHDTLSSCEWIFLTGYGDIPDSVRALRLGAFDFLTKPYPQEKLDLVVRSALRSANAQRRLQTSSKDASLRYNFDSFIGSSTVASQTQQMLRQLSQAPFSALILSGETGTGKGLATRILHYNSTRAKESLVELNCAALPKDLLESELFGYEAGAFTGAAKRHRGLLEQAQGGTLFLDEIAEMPLDLQAKLLKVIEDRTIRRLGSETEITIDIQLIAATNKNLQEEVSQGQFRSDLYHRLSVFELHLPSLHERLDDLHDLVPDIIAEFNIKSGKNITQIPPQIWHKLENYNWPGNVRELRNVLERSVLLSSSDSLSEQWLQLQEVPSGDTTSSTGSSSSVICLPVDGTMGLDEMTGVIVRTMLNKYDNNVSEVARVLKTTREKIRYRIDKYNLR
ncbi:MAG: sigma-54-dependent Fis family transcriptional regulator [Gammaproteobacteria bacterium]|nr:MAG: sigma-54-dependent Fis family transcriptional regulator [Gammaproteobacteria bacterium]